MTTLITVLIVLVSVLLILIIMVQNPKGGGLSSAFGGSGAQLLGGVKKQTDFLDRGTWTLAVALLVLVLSLNLFSGSSNTEEVQESALQEQLDGFSAPVVPQQNAPSGSPETENTQTPEANPGEMPEPVE